MEVLETKARGRFLLSPQGLSVEHCPLVVKFSPWVEDPMFAPPFFLTVESVHQKSEHYP
jgi:hypothetical protein